MSSSISAAVVGGTVPALELDGVGIVFALWFDVRDDAKELNVGEEPILVSDDLSREIEPA